jgi:hypothetical protein
MGILHIKDIPDDYPLSSSQFLQVDAEKSGDKKIDKNQIRHFLDSIQHPIYFLDFESIQPAVPMFDESRTYQQIVFQYSLHILNDKDELIHKEFLADANGDPRFSFLKKLINDLGEEGVIVVYNKTFEVGRLMELSRDFPSYKPSIDLIINRIEDLMTPFSRKHYYVREMNGSYSIKSVLPALVPRFSYDNLEINNGSLASVTFERLYSESDVHTIINTRQNLLEYCKMDTLAMVEILKVLQRV